MIWSPKCCWLHGGVFPLWNSPIVPVRTALLLAPQEKKKGILTLSCVVWWLRWRELVGTNLWSTGLSIPTFLMGFWRSSDWVTAQGRPSNPNSALESLKFSSRTKVQSCRLKPSCKAWEKDVIDSSLVLILRWYSSVDAQLILHWYSVDTLCDSGIL